MAGFFAKCSVVQRLLNQHAKMELRAKRRFRRSFFQISNFWSFSRFSDRSSKIHPTVASDAKRHFARAGETPAILTISRMLAI